jgi:single-stranded DNA-specific DHH superfamily exonuclease
MKEFAEFFEDIGLIFYIIKSKYRIKAPLNTRLSLEMPNKTILLLQESEGGKISISARRRDEKVAVNDLLENAIVGLEGASGGGHIPAAGATIRKQDLQKFKENIMSYLRKK